MPESLSADQIAELVTPLLEAGASAALPSQTLQPPDVATDDLVSGGWTSNPEASPVASAFVLPANLYSQLAAYLDLLLRWNARTNLTAIRQPEEIVRRHFGESLFAGRVLARVLPTGATLLDVGSGAGFPGLPIQLLRPDLAVTLAESQGKKASFLREAGRTLGLRTEVFAARVETLAHTRRFSAVTLRAVDNMGLALELAEQRVAAGGWLAVLGRVAAPETEPDAPLPGLHRFPLPYRRDSFLEIVRR